MTTKAKALCDEDAEYALTAMALMHPEVALPEIGRAGLKEGDFFSGRAGWVIGAALRLMQQGEAVDCTSVSAVLKKESPGLWADRNGDEWIQHALELAMSGRANPAHIRQYVGAVRDWAMRRKYDEMLADMREKIRQPGKGVDIINQFQYDTLELTRKNREAEWLGLDDMIARAWPTIQRNYETGMAVTGIESPSEKLDLLTTGFQRGEFVVISAEPRTGKTSFMVHTALKAVFNQGKRVLFGSWEMPPYPILLKILAAKLDIPMFCMRIGRFSPEQWERIVATLDGRNPDFPLHLMKNFQFLEAAGKTVEQFHAMVTERTLKDGPADLILGDYLQIIEPKRSDMKEHEAIASAATALKNMAIQFDAPVVVASQLNAEGRIFGSRVPFQHAHVHLKIEAVEEEEAGGKRRRIFFNLDKNRMGNMARWEVRFNGDYGTFEDLPDPADLAEPPEQEPPY